MPTETPAPNLPPRRAEVCKLRLQGWPVEDIADEVGASPATVSREMAAACQQYPKLAARLYNRRGRPRKSA